MDPLFIVALLASVLLGAALGVVVYKRSTTKRIGDADDLAKRIVEVFLNTEFEGGRHARRVGQLDSIQP